MEIGTAVDRGTTFRLTLPCYHSVADAKETEEVRLTLDRSLRVLVVDDDVNTREVVSGYLRGDGHRVLTATDGCEAMHRFMTEEFDLVITDHGMPGMNGMQLATAVNRLSPSKAVILLTGFSFEADQQPTSIDCVLKKPLVREELRDALRQVIGRHK